MLNVNIHLGEGYYDVIFGECLVYTLCDVKENGPVICTVAPGTGSDFDGAVEMVGDADKGLGILESQLICVDYIENDTLSLGNIGTVSNGKGDIDAALVLTGVVGDVGAGDIAVGDGDALIVYGFDYGVEKADIVDGAGTACGINIIADGKGLEKDEHNTACDVAEGTLQGKAYCKTGRTEDCNNRCHGDSENGNYGNDENNVKSNLYEVIHELLNGNIGVLANFTLGNKLCNPFDKQMTYNKQEKSGYDFTAGSNQKGCDFVDKCFHVRELPFFL